MPQVGRRPKISAVWDALPQDPPGVKIEDLAYEAGVAIATARKHVGTLVAAGHARKMTAWGRTLYVASTPIAQVCPACGEMLG